VVTSRPVMERSRPLAHGATRWTYTGLFGVALSTLMFEVLLTRVFSVTMFYHFAFVAISVAMFGMTAGAMVVFLVPGRFPDGLMPGRLAASALLFSLSGAAALVLHATLPAFSGGQFDGIGSLAPTYVLMSIPFFFSGVAVCLALTRYPEEVGRLYAADLTGAALGCLGTILLLKITDGPTAMIAVAAVGAASAACFARDSGSRALRAATLGCALLLGVLAAGHGLMVWNQTPWLRLSWVKGRQEPLPLYERWNSFSRISVTGSPVLRVPVSGWGLSRAFPRDRTVRELSLYIDSTAGTVLTAFGGDVREVEHLKYDIANLAHHIRRDADVLVIGSGGGRDILAALAFEQRSVVGVEINENIIQAVTGRFGDFTGHLELNPRVAFANDEARSYIARQTRRYDIIQISLIDTWAATAAGAFVLSENSLYTVEAWTSFLQHLQPGGLLSVTRWYFRDRPSEMYRATSLASAALERAGVARPRDHIVIARHIRFDASGRSPDGVGTMLISRTPFGSADLDRLERLTRGLGFEIVLSPRAATDDLFARLASGRDGEQAAASYPLDISAPDDDAPFFFHMLRWNDVMNASRRAVWQADTNRLQLHAVSVLATLLAVVGGLTLLCIVLPAAAAARRAGLPRKGAAPLFLYFAGIGMGFMLVEVSQMQRLIVFLGHPTYALSVVLFTLLLSGGLGSWLSGWLHATDATHRPHLALAGLMGALLLFGFATPRVAAAFASSSTPVRIALAFGILFCLGVFMGMALPIGMRLAASKAAPLAPWLWGVNGAVSVLASVLAVVIALHAGIAAAFWTGCAGYAAAVSAFLFAAGGKVRAPTPAVVEAHALHTGPI
jgi:predicted membrane-bound spermidine synthase